MQPDLTPKQQTSEAVRQAETILIITSKNPTVDQVCAVMALTSILRKFGKKVSAVISDPLPYQVAFLDSKVISKELSGQRDFLIEIDLAKAEVDKLRYEVKDGKLDIFVTPFQGGFSDRDVSFGYGDYQFDLAISLGVASRAKLDSIYTSHQSLFSSIPMLNLDYHRNNENFGAVNLIEPTASSLVEILVALSESLQTGMIDADISTTMLAGLIASTDRFTANHTTSKSMTVAAQLMAAGARQQAVIRGLYESRPVRENQPREGAQRAERSNRNTENRVSRETPQINRSEQTQDISNKDQGVDLTKQNIAIPNTSALKPEAEIAVLAAPAPTLALPVIEDTVADDRNLVTDDNSLENLAITNGGSVSNDSVAAVSEIDPIINPGHIELSPQADIAPVPEVMAQDVPAMADIAAAVEQHLQQVGLESEVPVQQPPVESQDSKQA